MEGTDSQPRSSPRPSPAVYRRRRLVAFLACGALLIGVVKVFSGLVGGSAPTAHTETSTAQAGRSTTTTAPAGTKSATSDATSTPALAGVTPCSPAALSVRAGVPSYQAHKPFVLPVTVQLANRLGAACRLDTSRVNVVVQSGAATTVPAWASQGCSPAVPSTGGTSLLVPAGRTVDWVVRWPAVACAGPLAAGLYDISARLDGGVLSGWAGTVTVS